MEHDLEKGRGRQWLGGLLAWILSAAVLLTAAALLVGRFRLNETQSSLVSALILLLSTAVSSALLLRGRKGKGRLLAALLADLVIAAVLLMLGFIILGDELSLMGALRVLGGVFLGACLGALVRWKAAGGKKDRRFAKAMQRLK